MGISFSQSFLDGLERIDNKVVIDGFVVDQGEDIQTSFQIVCHGEKVQVCVEGISGECGRLDFYCGEEIGFSITGENIIMNPERTIFEFNLLSEPKALIECPWVTEDTTFLESIGPELGNSLYKDIPISSGSLVWKETLGKYIVDRGIQDNHLYDVELFDTKSGVLEERPIRFKSYQNIIIEQGNWDVEMIKKSVVVKHDVYDEISSSSYLVWDSPMIDAKVNLGETPECINRLGEYVDPGNIIYGNTDCFQFTNYNSNLVGFRITGTEGSKVEVLFNRESSNGSFTVFDGTIGEDETVDIRFSDLPYLHLNGIRAIGPSRVTKIETIMFLEEIIDDYSPNPDKTFVTKLNNKDCIIRINGVCDYVEYEKYLGEVKEVGRGTEHIDNIPGITIKPVENGDLIYKIMGLEKQVEIKQNFNLGAEIRYVVLQVIIDNNIEVNGNIITTSLLTADYKIKIEQTGIIWKINNSPDYINGEDEFGIFLFGHEEGSERTIEIITNDPRAKIGSETHLPVPVQYPEGEVIFDISVDAWGNDRIIDGERWTYFSVSIHTTSKNEGDTWRPKKLETNDPYLVTFKYLEEVIPSISLYLIQLRYIENPIEIWEETIIPGQFTKVESKITLLNSMTKNFIVVKEGTGEEIGLNWYYYDLMGINRFYVTDQSFKITNVGSEYLICPGTTLLELSVEDRSTIGRVINVNRSDIIGSIGTLVATESPGYPGSWKNLIDNNTVSVEVERTLDNIYIQVGKPEEELKNEDYTLDISSISTFDLEVNSNFKYVIQTYGYIRIYPDEEFTVKSGYEFPYRKEIFNDYNYHNTYTFALVELDEDKKMEESYIEIRSGSLLRKITLSVVGPDKEHDYLLDYPDEESTPVPKPNLIRIFANGTVAPTEEQTKFRYTSTTTPKIEVDGINKNTNTTDPLFYKHEGERYGYHESVVPISVPNSRSLSYSKYPMKKFGYIREMSQDYSDSELLVSIGSNSYIEYPLYMKGKEHFLWCVDSLGGFSNISDPEFPSGSTTVDSRFDMTLDADGEPGKTIYIISRYSVDNRTFITEYPEQTEFKIKRDELEADIKISPQQSIGLDERSQIEYAIPIQVSCNIENNRGNIFLGSLEYKAKTEITEDSLNDVIEVDNNIAEIEDIDETYIKRYITPDKTQNLSVMIFQLGTDKTIFDLYSSISDLGIWATTNYIIPEIGSDYTLIPDSFSAVPSHSGDGDDIITVDPTCDTKYFLIKIDSKERVRDNGTNFHWYSSGSLPYGLIKDTDYTLPISVNYKTEGSEEIKTYTKTLKFKKYGCNYGLYVEGQVGFGVTEDPNAPRSYTRVKVNNKGGSIMIHAGIFHATNGIEGTEALIVPAEYKFIGENQPLEFSWVDGNKDDGGNLYIALPPRTRDDDEDKEYILEVIQPHEYYPLKLYVHFYQETLHGSASDTGKSKYTLMFLDEEIDVWSDGTVINTESNIYKANFVSNLSKDAFDKISFEYSDSSVPNGRIDTSKNYIYPDDLSLEEIERSYEEGYVKFRFKPNGSRYFINTNIIAKYNGSSIGSVKVKQGYYCLCVVTYHPSGEWTDKIYNYLSRKSPKPLRLAKIGTPPRGYYVMTLEVPCKTNNDNSKASTYVTTSRSVLKLTAYRREYNENTETEYEGTGTVLGMSDLCNSIELLNISPNTIFESYNVSITSVYYESDHDSKVDPVFNNNKEYATTETFGQYTPYVEIDYELKEEYIREYVEFAVNCKITIIEPETGKLDDYYFSVTLESIGSDEPQNIDLLEFSDHSLKYDYKGGTKQVSFSPASFERMLYLTIVGDSSWITANLQSNSNYISFKALENKSTEEKPAYYRTTQARIDAKDPRNMHIMGSFYVDLEQEPDIQQTSGSESGGSGGGGKVPSNIYVNIKIKNSSGKQVPITGEIKMYVGGHNGIFVNLPGASSSSTLMTLADGEETIGYSVNCVGNGLDPANYLDQTIENAIIVYAPDGGSHNSTMIGATISGDSLVFSNNASYVITLNSYDPGSSSDGVKIDIMLVNNQTTDAPIYLCGLIDFEVFKDAESTVTVTANLPVTSESSNIYSIPIGGSIGPYEVTCSGPDIENYLGNPLSDYCSVKYSTTGGGIADSYYRPYSISNSNNKFERETTYVITFEPKNDRSLTKGGVDEEIIEEPIPIKEDEEKNTK